MSIFGSLFTAVSGLTAQSDAIGMISNNIANVSTVGYKRIDTSFDSLVTTTDATTAYSPGSVTAQQVPTIDQQGILQQSASPTDIAISGNGFFVVKASNTDPLAAPFYTRAGSFKEDAQGNLKNTAGYFLYGWPLDQNGSPPAGQANLSSLVPVNVAFLGGLTQPTSTASVALNLNSAEKNNPYPVPAGTTPSYSTAVQVYDSLGTGHNLDVSFTKMLSPTATITGSTDLSKVSGAIAGQVGTIASTDSFSIKDTGTGVTTTITLNGTVADMLAQINAIKDPITTKPVFYAQLSASGGLSISARNLGDTYTLANVSGTPLNPTGVGLGITNNFQAEALGNVNMNNFSATNFTTNGFANTDSFSVSVGGNPPTTITLNGGTSKLITDLNAVAGLTASIDSSTGYLDLRASGAISLADVSGTPLQGGGTDPVGGLGMGAALAASPIAVSGKVLTPSQSPSLLTPLATSNPPDPDGWWNVSYTTPSGAVVTSGAINFFGNGQLNAVPDSNQKVLTNLSNIDWGNGSNLQNIKFDMAGFTQFASGYDVVSSTQNGAALGLQTGVSIDSDGFVVAQFSNGQSQKIYQLPIATFSDPNGLNSGTGNVYTQTDASGTYNLRQSNTGGAGRISSGTLEASNVDLATEFANMIVTQQAYSANSKVITTADQMTQALLQITA